MKKPELVFIAGCNAAGKSTFIRTRLNFDRTDFVYTGEGEVNRLIMRFQKGELLVYRFNNLIYPPKFAQYSFQNQRLNQEAYHIITSNKNFKNKLLKRSMPITKFKL